MEEVASVQILVGADTGLGLLKLHILGFRDSIIFGEGYSVICSVLHDSYDGLGGFFVYRVLGLDVKVVFPSTDTIRGPIQRGLVYRRYPNERRDDHEQVLAASYIVVRSNDTCGSSNRRGSFDFY